VQKYTSLSELDPQGFKYIVAGAFFQMQSTCIARIKEINKLVSGKILFIDVTPVRSDQQLLLCAHEREKIMEQLGAAHYFVVEESKWPATLSEIRKSLVCGKDLYRGPFFLSGLTESAIDLSFTSNFLEKAFFDNQTFEWHFQLGYYFPLFGEVVHGNKIGRTIGFPTLNIKPIDPRKLIPPMGVYAGLVKIGGSWLESMINIGIRPTIDDSRVTIETHVFGFSEEIYGERVMLHFTGRIRDEMKFISLEALKTQLQADQEAAFAMLGNISTRPSVKDDFLILV
jgi:hypothetical protein